jgi:hypothetical protein
MDITSFQKKLLIKPGKKMLVLNAPESYLQQLPGLSFDQQLSAKSAMYDWVQLKELF